MFCTGCSNVKYLKFPDVRTHFRDLTSATRMKFIAQRFLSSVIKEHHFLVPSETMPRALPPPPLVQKPARYSTVEWVT